ncbi:MAG: hypothetical protein Q7J61_00040, partial [Deltaproteobacteria bacterium]|nr:hypothetical protein [Deltaproteobacteria bacterium]
IFLFIFYMVNLDDLVKNQRVDGTVKSSSCKARKSYHPLTVNRCPFTDNVWTYSSLFFAVGEL